MVSDPGRLEKFPKVRLEMSKQSDNMRYSKAWLQHPQEGTSKQEPKKAYEDVSSNPKKN